MDHQLGTETETDDIFRISFKKFKSVRNFQPLLPHFEKNGGTKEDEATSILLEPTDGLEILEWDKVLKARCLNFDASNPDVDTTFGIPGRSEGNGNDMENRFRKLGLRCPSEWQVYDLKFPEGLIFIRNPFTQEGQRYWIKRSVIDFPNNNFITNIDNLENKEGKEIKCKLDEVEFYKKLRWVTFGYHHNWNTKVYTEESKCQFPPDLADLTGLMAEVLGFSNFKAEAAIANYYHLDSTLSGHVDKSEANQEAPLFSLSFGQPAVFLIGARTKAIKPQAILLRSGDVAIMSGESRLSYHGIPKVFYLSGKPWSLNPSRTEDASKPVISNSGCETGTSVIKKARLDLDTRNQTVQTTSVISEDRDLPNKYCNDSSNTSWSDFLANYVSKSRINLNVRQVLFPGHTELAQSLATKPLDIT